MQTHILHVRICLKVPLYRSVLIWVCFTPAPNHGLFYSQVNEFQAHTEKTCFPSNARDKLLPIFKIQSKNVTLKLNQSNGAADSRSGRITLHLSPQVAVLALALNFSQQLPLDSWFSFLGGIVFSSLTYPAKRVSTRLGT